MPTTTTKKRATTTTRAKSSTSTAKGATSTTSRSSQFPGALGLLHKDHEQVKKMFKDFQSGGSQAKLQLARQICQELTVHATLEEQSFYPLVRQIGEEFSNMVLEANEEHRQAKELIGMIEGATLHDEHFEPRMKVLMDDIMHHVEEEEQQLFPKLQQQVDKTRMEDWGRNLEQAKMRLMREGGMPTEQRTSEEVRGSERSRR